MRHIRLPGRPGREARRSSEIRWRLEKCRKRWRWDGGWRWNGQVAHNRRRSNHVSTNGSQLIGTELHCGLGEQVGLSHGAECAGLFDGRRGRRRAAASVSGATFPGIPIKVGGGQGRGTTGSCSSGLVLRTAAENDVGDSGRKIPQYGNWRRLFLLFLLLPLLGLNGLAQLFLLRVAFDRAQLCGLPGGVLLGQRLVGKGAFRIVDLFVVDVVIRGDGVEVIVVVVCGATGRSRIVRDFARNWGRFVA